MDEEILKEIVSEKKIEKEALKLTEEYRKVPEPDTDLLIAQHQKEINKLESSKINPQLESMKKQQLRLAVMKHISEQKRQNVAVNVRFNQNDLNKDEKKRGLI